MAQLKGDERARYVTEMFARISRRYDLMNSVMSGGRHYAWRHMATEMAVEGLRGRALDVATGTGDFAFDLARRPEVTSVVGLDFTREMMELGLPKAARQGIESSVSFTEGDAHDLPFPDDSFICATVGFGIRNFIDVPRALSEMARVVEPGGRVVSLEIVRQDGKGPISRLARFHFRYITPWIGGTLAGDREAYTYLPQSAQGFMSASELAEAMRDAGLVAVTTRKLALGTVAIHVGLKPQARRVPSPLMGSQG